MKAAKSPGDGIPISPNLSQSFDAGEFQARRKENKNRIFIIASIAFVLAVAVSFIARLLMDLIELITTFSFYGKFEVSQAGPAGNTLGIWVILVPAAGGLIVGLMALYGSKAIRGHGIPEAMEQILTNQSKIKPAITWLKPISSAITIGTGGPFGAEGPIIATGGALGSTVGQLLKISHVERKILLASSATAGMAAIFGSPIAAIFLAVELLLFEYSPRSLIPVAIACITGAAGHHLLFSSDPIFAMDFVAMPGNEALFIYSIVGVVLGILSVGVTKATYFVEDMFEKLPVHWMWWPAIGGIVVGVIGYFSPRTMGVGYDNITDILSGNMPMQFILSLCFLKFVSWVVALGSGTSGGTLAPLFTIGGAAGALIGLGINHFIPGTGINIPLAALVGMAAMFAGASRALLTSIIFALESTAQYNALLPLLGACTAAYFVSFFLMRHTIMTTKIERRGVRAPDSYESDMLKQRTVGSVLKDGAVVLSEDNTIQEVRVYIADAAAHTQNHFIVTDNSGVYRGMLDAIELYNVNNAPDAKIGSLIREVPVILTANDSLRLAVELMAEEGVDTLPVVSSKSQAIAGILTYKDILETYKAGRDEQIKQDPTISLRRKGVKILIKGKKFVSYLINRED